MTVQLPTKTASEVEIPGGLVVWVQTVNALHREQARDAADLYASREARTFRKGGEGFAAVWEQFEDTEIEQQCEYLANCGYLDGSFQAEAETKFPMPNTPSRNEGEKDEAFDKRVSTWEEASGKVGQKRAKHIEQRYEAVKRDALTLSETDRIERCCKATYERKRREAFSTRFILEMLARAVRQAQDHRQMVYASAEEVADLDDEIREVLITAYFSNDSVVPAAVPTLAGVLSGLPA